MTELSRLPKLLSLFNISKAPIYLFILILIIIVAMFYESNLENYAHLANKASNPPPSVNVLINQMELIISNEDGSHKAKVISSSVKHDPKLNITTLHMPILIINHDDANWHITAKTGRIIHNKQKIKQIEKIILSDQVKIVRTAIANKTKIITKNNNDNLPFLNLETQELVYHPQTELVTSDKPVTIISKESKTTAIGLKFNKKTQKLELLSNVKSVYYNDKIVKK